MAGVSAEEVIALDLRNKILSTRSEILGNLKLAVVTTMQDNSVPGDKWNSLTTWMGIGGNVTSIVGSVLATPALATPLVGASVAAGPAGCIIGVIGGGVSMFASYEQNLSKPDFSLSDNFISAFRDTLLAAIMKQEDDKNDLQRVRMLVPKIIAKYRTDPKWGPCLKAVDDANQTYDRGALVWEAVYRDVGNSGEAFNRMKSALSGLYKVIVDSLPAYQKYLNDRYKDSFYDKAPPQPITPGMDAAAAMMGVSIPRTIRVSDQAWLARFKTTAAYNSFLRSQVPAYATWAAKVNTWQ